MVVAFLLAAANIDEDLTAKNEKQKVPVSPFGPPHHHPDMPEDSRRLAEVKSIHRRTNCPPMEILPTHGFDLRRGQTLESQRYWKGQKPKTKCIPSLPPC